MLSTVGAIMPDEVKDRKKNVISTIRNLNIRRQNKEFLKIPKIHAFCKL